MSKPITKEDARESFLSSIRQYAFYWSKQEGTKKDIADGMAHSILTLIDGNAGMSICSMDLVLKPHPEDKADKIECCVDYAEDGMVINDDCHLSSMYSNEADQ